MNEITIGDKIYISSKRAAEVTGYAKDYVGQLCREGHVDAKMVGRSWYVYEPSIRAHRFGESTQDTAPIEEVPEEVLSPAPEPVSIWEKPQYKAETFEMIPELPVRKEELLLPVGEETLTDMQSAWKEWFQHKQEQFETPEIESPEVINARTEEFAHENVSTFEVETGIEEDEDEAEEAVYEEEVAIPLHKLESEPESLSQSWEDEAPEPIAIHHIEPTASLQREVRQEEWVRESEARIVTERIVRPRNSTAGKSRSNRSYTAVTALLLALCIITVTITAIGTGITDRYLTSLASENSVVKFLVGTREYNRK